MQILISADPFIEVPPLHYGGIERVIHMLITGYNDAGHQVSLIAIDGSSHPSLQSLHHWPHANPNNSIHHLKNTLKLRQVVSKTQPDIIHSFCRLQYITGLKWMKHTPFILQCYQREVSQRTTVAASKLFPSDHLQFSACGAHMIDAKWSHASRWHVVHNCTDTNLLHPVSPLDGYTYLAFLGRMEPIKGPKEAIELAKLLGLPIKLAGNIEEEHLPFFQAEIEPLLQSGVAEYVGPLNDTQKQDFLSQAMAFLMLIQWEEPFGIVMAEALACGAPILALNRGSVPEVVQDGMNGFRADSIVELHQKCAQFESIDRNTCRSDALERFSIQGISTQYLSIFQNALDTSGKVK